MEKRSFLLSCASIVAGLALTGPSRALKALAAPLPGQTVAERILRITRNAVINPYFLNAQDVANMTRQRRKSHVLISLQSRAEYEAGHVPGAMLLPPEDLAEPKTLVAFVRNCPSNKKIVLICPNGDLSSAVMFFLRQLGLKATALGCGMGGWNRNYAGDKTYPGDIGGEISTSTGGLALAQDNIPSYISTMTDEALVKQRSCGKFMNTLTAAYLREHMQDTLTLCLRQPQDYAAGHIPGSFSIPSAAFYNGDEILLRIPRDKKIILSCYTGNYSSAAALLLVQMGYDAHNLAWGMAGWNNNFCGPILDTLTQGSMLPVEQGPGVLFMRS